MTEEDRLKRVDEQCCEAFESAWMNGTRREIRDCLPPKDSHGYLPTLEELIYIRMELQWKAIRRSRERTTLAGSADTAAATWPDLAENYLVEFPELSGDVIRDRIVRQEFAIRRRCGDPVRQTEYARRFPDEPIDILLGSEIVATVQGDTLPHGEDGSMTLPTIPGHELLHQLGSGGMGVVYLARQLAADRLVAIKLIRVDRLRNASETDRTEVLERFRTEAQATARLEHPHVVSIYEVDADNADQPWFSMQYVEGTTLQKKLTDGPLPPRQCAEYTQQIAKAVGAAHDRRILHRDLKPQNVFVRKSDGRLLVGDFGLAKLASNDAQQTSADRILGTPAYMSPEQIRDASAVQPSTDIWSIGTILYRMLTGRPPFQAATVVETLRQVTDHQPVSPRDLNPQLDRDIDTICMKCLQKDPAQRYSSVHELHDDIERYLSGRAIKARPVSVPERTARWCRRNPLPAAMILLAIAGTSIAIAGLSIGYRTASRALAESDSSHDMARATVNDLLTEVSETMLFDKPGLQPLRRRLQEKALGYYRKFAQTGRDSPAVQRELGEVWYRIARIEQELGHIAAADEAFRTSVKSLQQMQQDNSPPEVRLALSTSLNGYGAFLISQQNWDKADQFLNKAVTLREQLQTEAPNNTEFRRLRANTIMNLGAVARNQQDYPAARQCFQTAQQAQQELLDAKNLTSRQRTLVTRDLAKAHYNLANVAFDENHEESMAEMPRHLATAARLFQQLCNEFPDNYGDQRRLIICQQLQAETSIIRTESITFIDAAIQTIDVLIAQNPSVPSLQAERQQLMLAKIDALLDLQEFDLALQLLDTGAKAQGTGESRVAAIMSAEAALLCKQLNTQDSTSRLAAAKGRLLAELAKSADDEELQLLLEDVEAATDALSP